MDPIMGTITLFAGNFAPRGWLTCEGQLLSINQYTALFSLLGTTYGGNGTTTFMLPDLRGAFPTQCANISGAHNGGSYSYGQVGGTQSATITAANLPPHTHTIVKGSGTNISGSIDVTTTVGANNSSTGSTAAPIDGNVLGKVTDLDGGTFNAGVYNTQAANASLGGVTSNVSNTLNFDPAGLTLTPWGSGSTPIATVPPFVAMQFIIAVEGVYPSRP